VIHFLVSVKIWYIVEILPADFRFIFALDAVQRMISRPFGFDSYSLLYPVVNLYYTSNWR
jgi:hypothetical protein